MYKYVQLLVLFSLHDLSSDIVHFISLMQGGKVKNRCDRGPLCSLLVSEVDKHPVDCSAHFELCITMENLQLLMILLLQWHRSCDMHESFQISYAS